MNKIYIEISKLNDKFKEIAERYTKDKTKINDGVQELFMYFLQMNPDRLKKIYDKDGIIGIQKYGAVALRRFYTSKKSSFYYKYSKYYKNLATTYVTNSTYEKHQQINYNKSIYNIEDKKEDTYQWEKLQQIDDAIANLHWYDAEIFKLYYEDNNTLDSLAEKTKISRNSLFTTIDKVREILKKKLNETI